MPSAYNQAHNQPYDQPDSPFIHTTPTDAVSNLVSKQITVGEPTGKTAYQRTFTITYPGNADQLLDHPTTQSAFHADEYIPYWAEIWPASQMLAQALVQQAWPTNTTALEIGCGVGLSGIVALSLGMHVIFSDYDATAVEFAVRNATANGFNDFERLPLDWRVPPPMQVPLLLAADVIYEERNIEPVIALIKAVVAPGGLCLLSDPDRSTRGGFRYALRRAGLTFTRQTMKVPGPEDRVVTGSVYRIKR
ncbi:MAG: 50S ribosomal protein L11 methyltransferase [Cyanobacteria bacterium J06621_3]